MMLATEIMRLGTAGFKIYFSFSWNTKDMHASKIRFFLIHNEKAVASSEVDVYGDNDDLEFRLVREIDSWFEKYNDACLIKEMTQN